MIVKVSVGHDFNQIIIIFQFFIEFQEDLLAPQHKSQLFPHDAAIELED